MRFSLSTDSKMSSSVRTVASELHRLSARVISNRKSIDRPGNHERYHKESGALSQVLQYSVRKGYVVSVFYVP